MIREIPEEVATELLMKTYDAAAFVLNDLDKLQALIQSVSDFPFSLVQQFIQKIQTYPDNHFSFESIQLMVAALLYLQSGKDLIPDSDAELGYVDDYAVLLACKKLVIENEGELS